MTRRVIDISHYEAPIEFKKVAADGIVAIIAKATQGTSWIDPAYANFKRAAASVILPSAINQRRARRRLGVASGGVLSTLNSPSEPSSSTINYRHAGGGVLSTLNSFLWGSYHFGTGADVKAQVNHYLETTKPGTNELICLDFEQNPTGSSMTLKQARQLVRLVEQRIGRYPVLYGGAWLKEQLDGETHDLLAQCPLWISQYAAKPILPPGWKEFALWQYTDGELGPEPRSVDGIGACDRSQYNGTVTQLRNAWPFNAVARRTD